MAFIRSNIKKYNFIEEDKNIFNFIKCKRENKESWWTMDLKLALYFIIMIL